MHLTVTPERLPARPGTPATVVVRVTNTAAVPRAYRLRTLGLDDAWAQRNLVTPVVQPGNHTDVVLTLELPKGFPAGAHATAVEATSLVDAAGDDPGEVQVCRVSVEVGAADAVNAQLEPRTVTHRRGRFRVSFHNRTRRPVQLDLSAESPVEGLSFTFDPARVELAPDGRETVDARVRGDRPLWGEATKAVFTVLAQGYTTPLQLQGTVRFRPRLSMALTKIVALFAVVMLWASLLAVGIDRVRSRGDADTASAVSDVEVGPGASGGDGEGGAGGGDGSDGEGGAGGEDGEGGDEAAASSADVTGVVEAEDPEGVAVTIEPVSLADDLGENVRFASTVKEAGPMKIVGTRPVPTRNRVVPEIRSTTTDETGRYAFARVPAPGLYRLRFVKAGYTSRSYVVETGTDGASVELDADLEAGDGVLAGLVRGPDGPLGGVEITATDGEVTLSTRTPTTGGDVGRFRIEGVSTPGAFLVSAERRGFGTGSELVELGGGDSAEDILLSLTPGVGSITGTILSPAGPLGGVDVTVTDGTLTRTTSSLTEGPVGTFVLPTLPVPATYTLTVEAKGWASQSKTIPLTGNLTENVNLSGDTATVYGDVTDRSNGTAVGSAGVTLRRPTETVGATEDDPADVVFKSTTIGDGSYELTGIPAGTYVLTVSHFEYTESTTLVTLAAGQLEEEDVSLAPRDVNAVEKTASVTGFVLDAATKGALPGVDVLVDGVPATVTSATGSFEAVDLGPGVHQLTFELTGYETITRSATVGIGGTASLAAVEMLVQASLKGKVTRSADGVAIQGIRVCAVRRAVTTIPAPRPPDPPDTSQCTGGPTFVTNAVGDYRFEAMPSGVYDVWFQDVPDSVRGGRVRYVEASVKVVLEVGSAVELDRSLDALPVLAVKTTDASSGSPPFSALDGATVTVTGPGSAFVSGTTGSGSNAAGTVGDIIPQVVGTYTVQTVLSPYVTATKSVTLALNDTRTVEVPMNTPGTSGSVILNYDYPSLSGLVSKRVSGATVQVTGISGYTEQTPGDVVPQTSTFTAVEDPGEAGKYLFTSPNAPLAGAAEVTVTRSGFQSVTSQAITVPSGGVSETIELTPLDTAVLSGDVDLQESPGVLVDGAGVAVTVTDGPGNPLPTISDTDSLGHYSASNLEVGEYELTFSKNGYKSLTGRTVDVFPDGGTADAVIDKLGRLDVTVNGLRLAGSVRLTLKKQSGTLGSGSCTGTTIGSTVNVSAGAGLTTASHSFTSLESGTYCVTATRTRKGVDESLHNIDVAVAIGGTSSTTFTFTQVGTVQGRILATLTTSPATTEAVVGATLTLTPSGGSAETAVTDSSGNYSFADVTAATLGTSYTLDLTVDTAKYSGVAAAGFPKSFTLTPDETETHDATITAQKGSVKGSVKDAATNQPIDGAQVVAKNLVTNAILTFTINTAAPGAGLVAGEYQFTNLDPVQWELKASAGGYNDLIITVNVQKGAQTVQDFTLVEKKSVITGIVRGKIGDGVATAANGAGTTVKLFKGATQVGGDQTAAIVSPDTEARYAFTELSAGTYTIQFSRGGWVTQTTSITVGRGESVSPAIAVMLPSNRDVSITVKDGTTNLNSVVVGIAPDSGGTNPGLSTTSDSTGSSGVYGLSTVAPGDYVLTVNGNTSGYTRKTFNVTVPPDTVTPTTTFTPTSPAGVSPNVDLDPTLEFVVTTIDGADGDSDPDPVSGAEVDLGLGGTLPATGSDGRVLVAAPTTGSPYTVTVGSNLSSTYAPKTFTVTLTTPVNATQTEAVRLFKDRDVLLTVHGFDSDGDGDTDPLDGATVTIKRPDSSTAATGTTPSAGQSAGVFTARLDTAATAIDYTVEILHSHYDAFTPATLSVGEANTTLTPPAYVLTATTRAVRVDVSDHAGALDGATVTIKQGATVVASGTTPSGGQPAGRFVSVALAPRLNYTIDVTKTGTHVASTGNDLDLVPGTGTFSFGTVTLKKLVTVTVTVANGTAGGGDTVKLFDGATEKHSGTTDLTGVATFSNTVEPTVTYTVTVKKPADASARTCSGSFTPSDNGSSVAKTATLSGGSGCTLT